MWVPHSSLWWNVAEMSILKRLILCLQQEKKNGYWLLWRIFKDYIKQNIVMAVLRKANSHSVKVCRLIKNNNVEEDQGKKTHSNLH